MFKFQTDKTFYTVKAENRQFEEALEFINETLRLHYEEQPQTAVRSLKKVQIAGTNGKGSTASMLSSILIKAGYKTGLYTSPSLVCVNERIRMNGRMISDSELEGYIPVISKAQENIGRLFGGFERITAASMLYYIDNNVDIAIMETGLGGRYDTVSAVEKLILASITSIDMDHMVMLGDTLGQIAREKCGIMRQNVSAVVHSQKPEAENVINECAQQLNCNLIHTRDVQIISAKSSDGCEHIIVNANGKQYNLNINLEGEYQRENAVNALLCALELRKLGYNISDNDIEEGIAVSHWEGRLQKINIDGIKSAVIIDGAHNPHAMKAVADHYITKYGDKKSIVLLSVMADKDIDGVLDNVARFANKVVCVAVTERSCKAQQLAELAKKHNIEAIYADSVAQGLKMADELSNGRDFYALGSLYLAGNLLSMTN